LKLVCVYCEAQGKARVMGEVEPLDDPTVSHGLCGVHRHQLRQEIEAFRQELGARPTRRFGRLAVTLPAVCRIADVKDLVLLGTVRTVGDGGMAVECSERIPTGSFLRVALHLTQGPIEVECRLVWTAPGRTDVIHGLAFTEPKPHGFAVALLSEDRKAGLPPGAQG